MAGSTMGTKTRTTKTCPSGLVAPGVVTKPWAPTVNVSVAAHQTAGWMHDDIVENRLAFRVQALQNAQRPVVAKAGHRLVGVPGVVER